MKNKKRKRIVMGVLSALLLLAVVLGVCLWKSGVRGKSDNLALQRGVLATSDSNENEELNAFMAIDGDDENISSRWSSENNREDASHYIELEFPEEISVSFVILKWERRNAISYALEGSLDGVNYTTLCAFDTAPEAKNQEIALEDAVRVRYLRLSTFAVSKEETDYSNLYQNVSLYEFEVYADKPAAYRIEPPVIGTAADGGRYLVMPEAPRGYEVTFIGADYEQIIGTDGTVYRTIQDKTVTVGFKVLDEAGKEEAREVSFAIAVPAWEETGTGGQAEDGGVPDESGVAAEDVLAGEREEIERNACPQVAPALAEWRGGSGFYAPDSTIRVIVDKKSGSADEEKAGELWETAELFARQYEKMARKASGQNGMAAGEGASVPDGTAEQAVAYPRMELCEGVLTDVRTGDIYLGYLENTEGLGEEGYLCDIDDTCVIKAESATGVRWGTVTLLQLLFADDQSGFMTIPRGRIRDYPLYRVRGFGIDVARKPVSLDTLYAVMEMMSVYKMNDLTVHLNDNTILSAGGHAESMESAMRADSAFRLESDVANEAWERLTSDEYAYTKAEFAAFIRTAKTYGVNVVPEIDTPAHSLCITKLYPEYALTGRNEAVDQIDLSNADARELVKTIWREMLSGEDAAFAAAEIVNIGMDEYYGDGEQYRQYLMEINDLVQAECRTVRLWGSLSNMDGVTAPSPDNLQMNIWNTQWADAVEMYRAGYALINMQNNHLYIIPGGGYDYLDAEELYRNWEPGKFYDYNQLERVPSYSPQMLGASYMIWNDMSGNLDLGLSEYDLFDRFLQPLGVLSVKLWGGNDHTAYGMIDKDVATACREKWDIQLYDTDVIEPSYRVRIEGTLPQGSILQDAGTGLWKEQTAVWGKCPYGEWKFYLAEPVSGKVGFAREGKTYVFDYALADGEEINLEVVGEIGRTSLYADGTLVDTLGNGEPFEEYATFVFPLENINPNITLSGNADDKR